MPFTISHAAVVLPFSRPLARWRLLSAAILGSMVPDFGLLMPWRPARMETHSAIGLLTFCLPVGLAAFWVFQWVIKTPMIEVIPNAAFERWRPFARPADISSGRQWIIAAVGVLCGAVTHLIWDGFTHEGARGVRMIPALDDPVIDFAGHHLVGARVLQDGSSLVGLVIVLGLAVYELSGTRASGAPPVRSLGPGERAAWVAGYILAAMALSVACLLMRHSLLSVIHAPAVVVGMWAIASVRGCAFSLLGVSLCLRLRLWLRADPGGSRAARALKVPPP